jgi:YD repeat-containing protein
VTTDYTGETGPMGNSFALGNIRPIRATTSLSNGTGTTVTKTETDYETFSANSLTWTRLNPTETRAYDFGSGSPGSLLRKTDYTYLHNSRSIYQTLNIVDRPTTIVISNGQGNTSAQTTNEYDNYTNGIQASGAIQRDSSRGVSFTTRGNVTAVMKWRNTDGAWLTTRDQYDDAGNVLSQTDPLQNLTTFDFTDSWASGGSSCATMGQTKAFRTTVTNALQQATKYSYFS